MPVEIVAVALFVVGLIALVAIYARGSAHDGQAHRRGPIGAAIDVVDASVGAYTIRRALGRSTLTRADRAARRARDAAAAEVMAAEDIRRRISGEGPVPIAPTRLVVAGTAATPPAPEDRTRLAHPVAAAGPMAILLRRRETALGLVAMMTVLVLVVAIWPRQDGAVLEATGSPTSGVVRASVTPEPTGTTTAEATPSPSAASTETAEATASATATPTPTASATATATPRVTPRPTPRVTPRPTPRPTATPAPTPTPTPTPTPDPTPEPTPTPVPSPVVFFDCTVSGLTVSCDGSASTDATSWSWEFGDGATGGGPTVSHAYDGVGDYIVTLTVSNASGSASDTQQVTIE